MAAWNFFVKFQVFPTVKFSYLLLKKYNKDRNKFLKNKNKTKHTPDKKIYKV